HHGLSSAAHPPEFSNSQAGGVPAGRAGVAGQPGRALAVGGCSPYPSSAQRRGGRSPQPARRCLVGSLAVVDAACPRTRGSEPLRTLHRRPSPRPAASFPATVAHSLASGAGGVALLAGPALGRRRTVVAGLGHLRPHHAALSCDLAG